MSQWHVGPCERVLESTSICSVQKQLNRLKNHVSLLIKYNEITLDCMATHDSSMDDKKKYEHNENHVIINIVRFNSWIMYIYTILHACSKLGWVIQEPQIKIIEYWLYWRGIKIRQSTTPKAHTNTHLPNKNGKKK